MCSESKSIGDPGGGNVTLGLSFVWFTEEIQCFSRAVCLKCQNTSLFALSMRFRADIHTPPARLETQVSVVSE